jgi:hypothetical protein
MDNGNSVYIGATVLLLPLFVISYSIEESQTFTFSLQSSHSITQTVIENETQKSFMGRESSRVMMFAESEIYHWVDEDGVAHFSQHAPAEHVSDVKTLEFQDTTPEDYDPQADHFGVQAQADRMSALREENEQLRAVNRERRARADEKVIIQYREAERGYYNGYWNQPNRPNRPGRPNRPQPKPENPIEESGGNSTLKPLRRPNK